MKRRVGLVAGCMLLFALALVYAPVENASAMDIMIVKVFAHPSGVVKQVNIEPDKATVKKGSVVVWVNTSKEKEVKVAFADGKRCADVTSAATTFNMESACYVTTWMPVSGTSSLQFNEVGTFEYSVEAEDFIGGKGKVVVTE
jgi:plastocyanin